MTLAFHVMLDCFGFETLEFSVLLDMAYVVNVSLVFPYSVIKLLVGLNDGCLGAGSAHS